MQSKIRFFEGEQHKKGSNVQGEVSVGADEHVERLVRCSYVMREDGQATIRSRGDQNRGQRHTTWVVQTCQACGQLCPRRSVCQTRGPRARRQEAGEKRRDKGWEGKWIVFGLKKFKR